MDTFFFSIRIHTDSSFDFHEAVVKVPVSEGELASVSQHGHAVVLSDVLRIVSVSLHVTFSIEIEETQRFYLSVAIFDIVTEDFDGIACNQEDYTFVDELLNSCLLRLQDFP